VGTGAWLFFEHDPGLLTARLIERAGRLELEPVGQEEMGEIVASDRRKGEGPGR
jgi:hypothetical protein